MEKWTRPEYYAGADWPEYYVFLSRHRDSDLLTESNFDCGLEAIGGESDTVKIVREGHWAVGWIEWIAIHESDSVAVEKANEILDALADYPVVNETDWSEREYNAACDYWANAYLSERIDLCRDAGASIFAARRDYLADDVFDTVRELIQ